MIRLAALILALSAAPAAAQTAPATAAPNYANAASWLCLPGRADTCSTPLGTTALNPNGYGSTGRSSVAANPPLDCFYVYPTVSRDRGMNSDMVVDGAERGAAQVQFARFASVCKTYAPIYRQMTLSAVAAAATGANVMQPAMLAYADIAAAWRTYLSTYNKGRPFVLIGHSQGSLMIQQLIKHEIEGKPIAAQMRLAIIPGYNLLVPQGKLVGGTLAKTPVCSRAGETGCVMTWVSFRENNPPPAGAIFGNAPTPGMTVACTNPARPGSKAWERLDSYWNSNWSLPVPGGPIVWSTDGAPPSPFVRTEGLVSARCINDGQRGYLSVRVNADPKDKRTDRVYGEVGLLGMFVPGWGMHLADVAEAQGDLIRQVGDISARSGKAPQPAR